MRVNATKVVAAWMEGRECRLARSIWTDGEAIYSYGTCIVERAGAGVVLFNRTPYSVTTTGHQNALASWLQRAGFTVREVGSIPAGQRYLAA